MPTMRIKSTHPPSQGDFVEIESENFDPAKGHVPYDPPQAETSPVETPQAEATAPPQRRVKRE